jgi:NAD-dependent deacetylase
MFKKLFDPYQLKKLEKLLKSSPEVLPIVILTGAGISSESGLATFRGQGGLWNGFKVDEVCRPEAFESNPGLVWSFYNQRREELLSSEIKPNLAHLELVKLEQALKEVYIITQNVDNLHERAGTGNLIHMHGQLLRDKCHDCRHSFPSKESLNSSRVCPNCGTKSRLRPDVVFFKEQPYDTLRCLQLVNNAQIFISIGTSGQVYPAASYATMAKKQGAITIEINPNKTESRFFDLQIEESASKVLPELVSFLIKKQGQG